MKKKIRKNVFETNSSSTHAICISKNNDYKKRDYIEFEIGEFGWEWDRYDSVHSRASYLITAIFSYNKDLADKQLNQLKELLKRNNIEYVLPEPKVESYKWDDNVYYYYDISGYIDHANETKDFVSTVLSNDDIFMRYMFGDSYILTGNDNSDDGLDIPEEDDYEIYEKWN